MFYFLLKWMMPTLAEKTPLHLFSYTSVRAACALFLAFTVSLLFGSRFIAMLRALNLGQQVRVFKTQETQQFNIHQEKAGTPLRGGLLIIGTTLLSVLLFCDPSDSYVWIVMLVMLSMGALGFMDDYLKVVKKNHKGVPGKMKILVQSVVGLWVGAMLFFSGPHTVYSFLSLPSSDTHLLIPFLKNLYPDLGIYFIVWVAFGCATATSIRNACRSACSGPPGS